MATFLNPKVITLHVRHFTTYQAHFLCHIKMTTLPSMTIAAKYYTGQLICLMCLAHSSIITRCYETCSFFSRRLGKQREG